MRVLILGAKGQLGRDLSLVFSQRGEVIGFGHAELDIANTDAVEDAVRSASPDIVVNAAAYTNVEGAEDHIDDAYRVNEAGARVVAKAARDAGAPVVFVSTDFVFAGDKKSPYEVTDPIDPRGVYAQSKSAGEAAVRAANPMHFIVRTAWLYGPGGNNFVEKIVAAAKSRPTLKIVTDEVGSPTHTFDLAEAIAALVNTRAFGTYHGVNAGQCSRFAFARTFLNLAGLKTPVEPCLATDFPSKAPRPKYSVLSTQALKDACGYQFRPWQDALEHYMKRRNS
jgi:dTDP-4-dehydrorhamnose reductase